SSGARERARSPRLPPVARVPWPVMVTATRAVERVSGYRAARRRSDGDAEIEGSNASSPALVRRDRLGGPHRRLAAQEGRGDRSPRDAPHGRAAGAGGRAATDPGATRARMGGCAI